MRTVVAKRQVVPFSNPTMYSRAVEVSASNAIEVDVTVAVFTLSVGLRVTAEEGNDQQGWTDPNGGAVKVEFSAAGSKSFKVPPSDSGSIAARFVRLKYEVFWPEEPPVDGVAILEAGISKAEL